MAVINFARREIITKIVYFGAQNAGCHTMVRTLFASHTGRVEGGLLPFGPESGEMSQFFQYTPDEVMVPGFNLAVRVYSLPGGLSDPIHRIEVLKNLDAVVFVADARPGRSEANIDALLELDTLLEQLDIEFSTLPQVFHVNHADHEDAGKPEQVSYDLNPYGCPVVSSNAKGGDGVTDGQRIVLEEIVRRIRENLAGHATQLHVHAIHRRQGLTADQVVKSHERAIQLAHAEAREDVESEDSEAPWTRSRYDILPTGLTVQTKYQPVELAGMRPVHILDTRLDHDKVHIELVMDDHEGSHPTRLRITLMPPEKQATPTGNSGTMPAVPMRESATATLPDRIEIVPLPPDRRFEVAYGILGASAGLVAGLLAGFLLWA
ncbi:MAG: hypothetical protein ACI9MC_004011 [Kiritimatiellia bacterium]|jgi:hypothetical protein